MKTRNISNKEFKNLEKFILEDDSISKSECELYMYGDDKLIKMLYNLEGYQFANKLYTCQLLNDYVNVHEFPEFVLPEEWITLKGDVIGFTVPYISESNNFGVLLHNNKIDLELKLKYLAKIGDLVERVSKIKGINFRFNDLHEYNFLVTGDNEIKAVDLDSVCLTGEYPISSYYGYMSNLSSINKYRANYAGVNYPSRNLDLLSYNTMLLNTLSNDNMLSVGISDYFEYIDYLETLGYGKDILNAFRKVYDESDNINASNYFDQIPMDKIYQSPRKLMLLKKKKVK